MLCSRPSESVIFVGGAVEVGGEEAGAGEACGETALEVTEPWGDGLAETVQGVGEAVPVEVTARAALPFCAAAKVARRLARASRFLTCAGVGRPVSVSGSGTAARLDARLRAALGEGLNAAAFVRLHPQHQLCSVRLRRLAAEAGQSACLHIHPLGLTGERHARPKSSTSSDSVNCLKSLNCCANDGPEPHRDIVGVQQAKISVRQRRRPAAAIQPLDSERAAAAAQGCSAERRHGGSGSAPRRAKLPCFAAYERAVSMSKAQPLSLADKHLNMFYIF